MKILFYVKIIFISFFIFVCILLIFMLRLGMCMADKYDLVHFILDLGCLDFVRLFVFGLLVCLC